MIRQGLAFMNRNGWVSMFCGAGGGQCGRWASVGRAARGCERPWELMCAWDLAVCVGDGGGYQAGVAVVEASLWSTPSSSLSPVTDDANGHAPRPAHPGRPAAAPDAAPIAASANRAAPGGGITGCPPSPT